MILAESLNSNLLCHISWSLELKFYEKILKEDFELNSNSEPLLKYKCYMNLWVLLKWSKINESKLLFLPY